MAENRIYAYCRVSKNDGTMTIENQTHAIEQWAKANNIKISAFYKDECKGDTPIEKRSQLPVLLDNLRGGDTVVVVEVFRLYRSVSGLEKIYRTIVEDKKAEFITLNEREQILCTANTNKDDIMQMNQDFIDKTLDEFKDGNPEYSYELADGYSSIVYAYDEKIDASLQAQLLMGVTSMYALNGIIENNTSEWSVEIAIENCHTGKTVAHGILPEDTVSFGESEWRESYE